MSPEALIKKQDFYIIVDIEASGPYPGKYAMLSIGACTLEEPRSAFYVELIPDSLEFTPEAMEVNQLSINQLKKQGMDANEAMQKFSDWVMKITPIGAKPVFTAFNAPFDWMFVNEYFHRYLGYNPFGHSALDIKAFYMGLNAVSWQETSHKEICKIYCPGEDELPHQALEDAVHEAELFLKFLQEASKQNRR